MSQNSWGDIEELFFRGLNASAAVRHQLLSDVADPHVVAAVAQLWTDAANAPSGFLRDATPTLEAATYALNDVVENRFRLDAVLGTGGMGQVFAAHDKRLDRLVALKFLNPHLVRHPVLRGLLEREARAVCRLAGHPNICTVHDLCWTGETPFLVMELLSGETLAARLGRGPLPIPEAVSIGRSIVEGLIHAHARDVIHRDLKPGNVMLSPFGPKLVDFGIAKQIEPVVLGDVSLLAPPGMFVGSVSYTSPEQAEGLPIDARSDIFSVGCVLYEMATGAKAFDGASRIAILSAVLRAEPADIRTLNPNAPLAYTRIVADCLHKDRTKRFQRATDLRDALDRVVFSEPGREVPAERQPVHAELHSPLRATPPDQSPGDRVTPPSGSAHAGLLARGVIARGNLHPMTLGVSVVYGAMVGLALPVEVAYEWAAWGSWALPIAVVTGAVTVPVALMAFALMRRSVASQRSRLVLAAVGIFVGWSVLLGVLIGPQLPDRPLVRATIQTMTASVGYPKSLLEALALPLLALVPLQVVCALEAELHVGRARNVFRILASPHQRLSVPGTVIVRPGTAAIVFAIVSIWWMGANGRLLESLQDAPYYGLFLQLAMTRAASGLLMLFALLVWYIWTWNDLRQAAQERLRH